MNPADPSREPPKAPEVASAKACPTCGTRYPADALFCSLDGSPLANSPGAIAAAAATDPYLGREILGHIEIRQLVGIGAMGRVYRAFQRGIDRDVAVKILHRELSANQTLVTRFHREAKVASRLAHPNVVHVLLVGQLPDGAMYIVMEYLDGMSLQSALAAAGGAMPLPRALHVAMQLSDAAGEAHANGIVHRDLKPENVMLVTRADDPDFVKVLDFGIARLNWDEQSMATAAGLIFGTARYISPEGAQGEKVDPTGDVYSIATMLYQMLSARTPFDADQAVALLVQQIHDPPQELRSIARASYVPDPIATVVMKNLSKRPSDRAADARAFGRALLEAAVASGLSAQDILARPSMGRGAGAHASVVQMPSMQRTNKLQLGPDAAGNLPGGAAWGKTEAAHATKTAYETPPSSPGDPRTAPGRMATEIDEGAALPPGSATTKWTPGADFEARLVQPPAPTSVDATMDDQQAPLNASASRPGAPAAAARPPSSVHDVPYPEGAPRRVPWARPTVLVVRCFLCGALGTAAAWRAGIIGSGSRGAQLAALVARANDALLHQRWDTPPGDNVSDLTDDGLARWPREPQLLGIRALAAQEIAKTARGRREAGDPIEALRLAKLATRLDPTDEDAVQLAAASAGELPRASPQPESSVPPLVTARAASNAAATVSGAVRVVLDASNAKPGIGQPVDFTARVVGGAAGAHSRVDGARFRIAGPGIAAGTELPVADDGSGSFRTTFTFLQGGKFEVLFYAYTDGAPARASRTVHVAATAGPSAPPTASTPASEPPAQPASSGTDKWL